MDYQGQCQKYRRILDDKMDNLVVTQAQILTCFEKKSDDPPLSQWLTFMQSEKQEMDDVETQTKNIQNFKTFVKDFRGLTHRFSKLNKSDKTQYIKVCFCQFSFGIILNVNANV